MLHFDSIIKIPAVNFCYVYYFVKSGISDDSSDRLLPVCFFVFVWLLI